MSKRTFLTFVPALVLVLSSSLYAGQKSTVGFSDDFTTGVSGPNTPGLVSTSGSRYAASFGTYPSLKFNAKGQRNTFDTSYSFGFNKYFTGSTERTNSHAATQSFSSVLGPKSTIRLTDSFEQTTNSSTFRLLRGDTPITPDPQDFRFIFDPVNAGDRRSYSGGIGLDQKVSERASLTFNGNYSVLDYLQNTHITVLSNQKRAYASVGYSHSLARGSWNLSFSGSQTDYSVFQTSRTYAATAGYSRQLSKALTIQFGGGPSYVDTQESIKHHVGINASVGLAHAVKQGSVSISFAQSNGDSSGLGSVATNRQAGLGVTHSFGRKTTLSVDTSAFDTSGQTAAKLRTWGVSAGGSVGYSIARMWSLNVGGQFQHYTGNPLFSQNQRRIFASLRFNNPELWRF